MKTSCLWLMCAVLAGCSSTGGKNASNTGAQHPVAMVAASPAPSTYHAKLISEFSEGESKFLEMAPADGQ